MMLSKEQSNIIYNMKALCILSAVCAHTSTTVNGGVITTRLSCLMSGMGSIGVPIFFLLSGMLFAKREYDIGTFWKKKVWSLLLPWFLTGTIVWLYVVLRKGGFSFVAWINYVLGNGSYLYYMSMLMICYLLFLGKSFGQTRVIVFGGCSFLWLILECFDVVNTSNPYINPLNWIVYFTMGILISHYDLFTKLLEKVWKFKYVIVFIWTILVMATVSFDIMITYWNQGYLAFELISFCLLLLLARVFKDILWVTEVGKQSFAIYLLHMLFTGIVNALFAKFRIEILLMLKPIMVIGLVMICIMTLKYFDQKAKLGGKLIRCVGIR